MTQIQISVQTSFTCFTIEFFFRFWIFSGYQYQTFRRESTSFLVKWQICLFLFRIFLIHHWFKSIRWSKDTVSNSSKKVDADCGFRAFNACACAEKSLNESADLLFYMLIGECKNLTLGVLICFSKSTTGEFVYFDGLTPPKLEHIIHSMSFETKSNSFFFAFTTCAFFLRLKCTTYEKQSGTPKKQQQQRQVHAPKNLKNILFLFIHLVLQICMRKKEIIANKDITDLLR